MANALIVGGRGQCGLAIAGRLRDQGWRVTATASGPIPDIEAATGIDWVQLENNSLDALANDVDVVVHMKAYSPLDALSLIELGDRIGSAIAISTLSVYSDDSGRSLETANDEETFPEWPVPIPEDWPLVAPADTGYSPQKAAIESVLRKQAPFPVTIVRPGAIHGPYSHHLREWYFIKRILDRREMVVLPFDASSIFQPTATTNLAELVSLACARPGDRVVNCGDIDPPTVAEISEIIDDIMGWQTERIVVPGPEPRPTVGNHPWAVPRPVVADMSRAITELDYRQPVSYAEALASTVPWAVEACRDRDWKQVFTQLVNYPNLFDYDAEDLYLTELNH